MVCLHVLFCIALGWNRPDNREVARVEMVQGTASVISHGHAEPLHIGRILMPDETIATGTDGFALVRTSRGDRFEVYPASLAAVPRMNRLSAIDLWLSRILNRTNRRAPASVIAVRG